MGNQPRKVGTIIKETLASYGITDHTGCGCTELAAEINRLSLEQIESKIEEYVVKISDSARRWRGNRAFIKNVPTPHFIIRMLIQYAISQSRMEHAQ